MTNVIDQQQLAQDLVEAARAHGVELVGPGGLLTGLTKTVLGTALEAEMSEHLGYDKHDPTGRNGANSRNGTRTKAVVYGAKVSRDTISRITDTVLRADAAWQAGRPAGSTRGESGTPPRRVSR